MSSLLCPHAQLSEMLQQKYYLLTKKWVFRPG